MRKPFVGQIFLEGDRLERNNSYLFEGRGNRERGEEETSFSPFVKYIGYYVT